MTLKHIKRIFADTALSGTQKLVLLTIAYRASKDGVARLSFSEIASVAGVSPRTVVYAVNDLKTHELLAVESSSGRGAVNKYTLLI